MSRPPESSFFDGHVDALSYIHFIYERIQYITKISFNRKISENDLQIKLTQNFLVPIPYDEFVFSEVCLPPFNSSRSRRQSRRFHEEEPRIDMDSATPGKPSVLNDMRMKGDN